MKLLFDQNLSPRLVERLIDLFPSEHVASIGLERASDEEVWVYAREHGCVIVTKDSDFNDLTVLRGFPPKVLWLRLGDCTTKQVESTLRTNRALIEQWMADPNIGSLSLKQR